MNARILFCFCVLLTSCSTDATVTKSDVSTSDVVVETDGFSVDIADAFFLDAPSQSDVAPDPGTFGASCEHAQDCDSGLCLQTADGKQCSMTCQEACPYGFDCMQVVGGGSDVQFACVSRLLNLCRPCETNQDCNWQANTGNACVSFGDAGSFCGVSCSMVNDDCPHGYVCGLITDQSGQSSSQCIPSKKSMCACSPYAIEQGFSTACVTKSPFGACAGVRQCAAEGLTACSGPMPESESCDGIDNDCDGKTDNVDLTTFGVPCDRSNQFGVCQGHFVACEKGVPVCDAMEPSPESCNGKDDDCDGETDEALCQDGNSCTTDVCNTDGSCKHSPLTGPACDDENICTALSKCAAGLCQGGDMLDCDDNDPCSTDWCDPFSGCKHKPSSDGTCFDDGNSCTQDVCKNGACTHPQQKDGFPCLEDGNVCTSNVCKDAMCTQIPKAGKCDDGQYCTVNDTCKDGACIISDQRVCEDNNPCTVNACSEQKKSCVFTPNAAELDGLPCPDDGNPCTVDSCKGSSCAHLPIPGCAP